MRTSVLRPRNNALVLAIVAAASLCAHAQHACNGSVREAGTNKPIAHAYIALTDEKFSILAQGATETNGAFKLNSEKPLAAGYVLVQPPAQENREGIGVYRNAPRIYAYKGETVLDIALPAAANIVLRAYDTSGKLMRWEDFRARGTFGDQFMYLTGTNDCALEATCWPAFDAEARKLGQPREKGLPALVFAPGHGLVPQVLFWETTTYGKLLLRADNAGKGFSVATQGDVLVLDLNVELARTAVHDLARRKFSAEAAPLEKALAEAIAKSSPQDRASAADAVLADALRLRDDLEFARAKTTIAANKRDAASFRFGVFEGSPYNEKAFQTARDAGFSLATLLLGWGWTDANGGALKTSDIETTFGIDKLAAQGYALKSHGNVWLQDYGILPVRAQSLQPAQLAEAMLTQQSAMLDTYGKRFAVWEAMNEPNVTNVVNMPRDMTRKLLRDSGALIKKSSGPASLVNGAHEGDYGRRFSVYALDNTPLHDWNRTYLSYLEDANAQGALDSVDVVGLQYYPGFQFNESFGGLQGPATTPSWLIDTIDRYAELGKTIHITEVSFPSSYQSSWTSGFWRERWTPETQADYAEMIFAFAYAHPEVESISWWDIYDTKSSVITGGLCDANGKPKPVLDRLRSFMAALRSP
ncbi:MAG TPA: endo-1,4-beta-xylanase [Candidatus Hydrogenedentes bacterium]|mgnify:FL=1|nr:endo-1,4-beta-xylanase [Candidatus Hydrogenedentota bacterium]